MGSDNKQAVKDKSGSLADTPITIRRKKSKKYMRLRIQIQICFLYKEIYEEENLPPKKPIRRTNSQTQKIYLTQKILNIFHVQ
jgi:hypothetical protein